MAPYGTAAFLEQLAPQIVAEIQTAAEIKKFTSNTEIVGQYVEASVRQFIRKYLAPIRVSTGGVIDQEQTPGAYIPQLDTIAWIPGPVSAIFEVGDFGLVPRSSCLGIIEVKSSGYSGAIDDLELRTAPEFVKPLTAELRGDTELRDLGDRVFALGVISLLQNDQKGSLKLKELRDQERISVIYEQDGDRFISQQADIYRLINFLAALRYRAAQRAGLFAICLPGYGNALPWFDAHLRPNASAQEGRQQQTDSGGAE